ncbi:MAG: BrnT family toxin [Chloroflexi bacterium]|nr:BrnT family toxin [Chloroflexota bacterium]
MFIRDLIWDDENLEHIAAHGVESDEVEDVCFGNNRIERAGKGKHGVLGRTSEGRLLFIVVAHRGHGLFRVITARDMNTSEQRRYVRLK